MVFSLHLVFLILWTPHSPYPTSAASFHFVALLNAALLKEGQLPEVKKYFNLFHLVIDVHCKQLFLCMALKSHVCLLEGEFTCYVGLLNNSKLP